MIPNFDPKINTIFCDMDGVVADFDLFVFERMGRTFDHMSGPGADKEMWDFLKTIPHLYLQLKATWYAERLWDAIKDCNSARAMLTAIPRRTSIETAEADKRLWVINHRDTVFHEDVAVFIGPYSRDKWTHAKPGDILIDDRSDNIQDWINKGFGIGILHDHEDPEFTFNALKRLTP